MAPATMPSRTGPAELPEAGTPWWSPANGPRSTWGAGERVAQVAATLDVWGVRRPTATRLATSRAGTPPWRTRAPVASSDAIGGPVPDPKERRWALASCTSTPSGCGPKRQLSACSGGDVPCHAGRSGAGSGFQGCPDVFEYVQLVYQPLGSRVALRWRREKAPILRGRLVG